MTSQFQRFGRDRRSAAFVELAIALPIMVAMYLGCYEIFGIVCAYMKAANAAQTLAELAASDSTGNIRNSDMVNYCNGAKLVMSPRSVTGTRFKAAVASVTRSSNTNTQDWQDTSNCGSASPASLPPPRSRTISEMLKPIASIARSE